MLKRKPKKVDVNLNFNVNEYTYLSVAVMIGGQIICSGLDNIGHIITTGINTRAKKLAKKKPETQQAEEKK